MATKYSLRYLKTTRYWYQRWRSDSMQLDSLWTQFELLCWLSPVLLSVFLGVCFADNRPRMWHCPHRPLHRQDTLRLLSLERIYGNSRTLSFDAVRQ